MTITPKYAVGTNMPGYMPDEPALPVVELEDAKNYLIEEVETDAEQREDMLCYVPDLFEDPDAQRIKAEGEDLRKLAAEIRNWQQPNTAICAGRAYWIQAL